MSATVQAISADNITAIGAGTIVVLVIIGVVLGAIITKLLIRAFIALVVVVLAIVVWQQRGHIQDEFDQRACNVDPTFFGIHVDPPDDFAQRCAARS